MPEYTDRTDLQAPEEAGIPAQITIHCLKKRDF